MRSGKLKGQKFGRKTVRMWASDLDAFMHQQQPPLTLVDTTAPARASTQAVEQPFDADILALAEKLRQPGERLADAVLRVLQQALQAQDAQGSTPMVGDAPHPAQYREAMAARVREMSAQGLSNRKIAAQLNAEKVPTLKGDIGRWHHSTIADLLPQG